MYCSMAFIFEGANFKRKPPAKQGFKAKKGGNDCFTLNLGLLAKSLAPQELPTGHECLKNITRKA
ncbi:hypothetical protein TQ33_1349 [Kangiella geojedonensis]|uniref:Uncharacterized protein n=1 Tax=Kangiella geojedonensis TaxID=914150 RepID=A0A0F6TR90_9GAMM|nr:hypothetical protein TQ33_1349 [Kangiella geojedonensis]